MVTWSRHALAQLRHIHGYIAQDSPLYARRVSETLVSKTMALNELPHLGRVVPELNDGNVRELPVYAYRILYAIKPDHIRILAVIHKRQDLHPGGLSREP